MTPENYCETCQTLAVVCPDESHPKTYTKQSPDTHTNNLVIEERCDICEARGCSIASHTKSEIELKALCRQTIFTTKSGPGLPSHIPRQKNPNGNHYAKL